MCTNVIQDYRCRVWPSIDRAQQEWVPAAAGYGIQV